MSQKIAVITGVAGQDGAYLADFLVKKKYQVIGLTTSLEKRHLSKLEYFKIKEKIICIRGDVLDKSSIKKILTTYKPHEIYNLAGQSSVARSWEKPNETLEVNTSAVLNILEQIRLHHPRVKFFQASSSEMYGNTNTIVTEKLDVYRPLHPYGTSKLAAHLLIDNYRKQYGMFACSGILFNHESPLRDDHFVSKIIVKGVARIARGLSNTLELGNMTVRRDFGYAGDFVEAMWLMLQSEKPEDFVVCSGESFSIADFVREAFLLVGIKDWKKYVKINPARIRKQDVKYMRGSSQQIKSKLGWVQKTSFKELLEKMVTYELENISV